MNSVSCRSTKVYADHAALDALVAYMADEDYTGWCRAEARRIVALTGDVSACVPSCLDAEHLAAAEAAYVDALPPVHQSSPSWDDRGVYLDVESIADAAAGRSFRRLSTITITPPELDDDFDDELNGYWPGGDS